MWMMFVVNLVLLGLQDILIGGGGLASGVPGAGLGAMAAVRGFQQPFTLTNLGFGIQKGLVAPITKTLGKQIPGQLGTTRQAIEQITRQIGFGTAGR